MSNELHLLSPHPFVLSGPTITLMILSLVMEKACNTFCCKNFLRGSNVCLLTECCLQHLFGQNALSVLAFSLLYFCFYLGSQNIVLRTFTAVQRGGDPLILCFVDFVDAACAATALSALQGNASLNFCYSGFPHSSCQFSSGLCG